jgi:hypothetical protein
MGCARRTTRGDACTSSAFSRPDAGGSGGLGFATDSLALHVHWNADSHFDALCHVSYDGTSYNDLPAATPSAVRRWSPGRGSRARRAEPASDGGVRAAAGGLLGSDGNNGTLPCIAVGVDLPAHVLAAGALGPHLLDYFALEDLAAACHAARRWTFLCVIVPLRLPAGTGLPVNPIVLF